MSQSRNYQDHTEVSDLSSLAFLCKLYGDEIKNMEVVLAPQWVPTQLGREVWNGEKGILGAIVTFEPISESDLVEAFNDLGAEVGVELERLEKKKLITRISGKVTSELLNQLGDVLGKRSP